MIINPKTTTMLNITLKRRPLPAAPGCTHDGAASC
jgi:hypothetical protein